MKKKERFPRPEFVELSTSKSNYLIHLLKNYVCNIYVNIFIKTDLLSSKRKM